MQNADRTLEWLNYHHLRHFWVIARHRNMTRAAEALHVSQSTLSEQLRELEASLGQPLFERRGRQLHLTGAGRIALEHAETIFATGRELLDQVRQTGRAQKTLTLGAVGPLSKNLQFDFIEPLLSRGDTRVTVVAGALHDLVSQLHDHKLDLVLSNIPLRADEEHLVHNHLLGETPVFLAGRMRLRTRGLKFPYWLKGVPLLLPTRQSHVRADFELLLAGAGVEPQVRAEVDDMALLRLLALSGHGLALVSSIVVERELESHQLQVLSRVPGLAERFYAISLQRRLGSDLIEQVVSGFRARLEALTVKHKPVSSSP